jgi:transposase
MIKDFKKDEQHKNLYWLSITDFSSKYKWKYINIPLILYKEVINYLNAWYKYTFALHKDYIEMSFKINIEKQEKYLTQAKSDLNVISIDFWKYLSTYDWKNTQQYNLSKFYRKVKKLQGMISEKQSVLSKMKNDKSFWKDYKDLKNEIQKLFLRIKNIRKHTYWHVANKIVNNPISPDVIVIEDLNFTTIQKYVDKNNTKNTKNKDWEKTQTQKQKSKDYKWKAFNTMINVMGRWIWKNILENKVAMVGNHISEVSCRNTSRECFHCWYIDKCNRRWRNFKCVKCCYRQDSDINASMIIFKRWLMIES